MRHFESSVELGFDHAALDIAEMHKNGEGVAKDINKAIEIYKSLCDRIEDGQPEIELAILYYEGTHVEKNMARARSWAEKAQAKGSYRAEDLLFRIDQQKDDR